MAAMVCEIPETVTAKWCAEFAIRAMRVAVEAALKAASSRMNVSVEKGDSLMTYDELRQAAIDCLGKVFKGDKAEPHVVQSAVAVVLAPTPIQQGLEQK